jgi:hypothetical protein
MTTQTATPQISNCKWGTITLENGHSYKDAKLWPGGDRAWDWNETGTSHSPGIQPADVKELVEHGAEHVILSQGFHDRLKTQQQTRSYLDDRNITYEQLNTEAAVGRVNELIKEGKAVGALIHSTC